MTDADGNSATGTITINIVDDVPTAHADTNSVVEGAIVTGNVLTGGTADVFGAGRRDGAGGRRDRGCGRQRHLCAGCWPGSGRRLAAASVF